MPRFISSRLISLLGKLVALARILRVHRDTHSCPSIATNLCFFCFPVGWSIYWCHRYPPDALLHVSRLRQLLRSILRFPSSSRKSRPVAGFSHLSFPARSCTNLFGKANNEKSNRIPVRLSDKLSLYLRQTIKSKRYGKV